MSFDYTILITVKSSTNDESPPQITVINKSFKCTNRDMSSRRASNILADRFLYRFPLRGNVLSGPYEYAITSTFISRDTKDQLIHHSAFAAGASAEPGLTEELEKMISDTVTDIDNFYEERRLMY